VPAGDVTPRGVELARLLGVFYRDHYTTKGLLPTQGCPSSGTIDAWADINQRTRITAQALLDGMFPRNLAPGYGADAKVDPLFHPTRAGVCRLDLARARQSVIERAGGNFVILNATFRPEIAAMQTVLKCCTPALCSAAGTTKAYVLGEPAHDHRSKPRWREPLAVGSGRDRFDRCGGFPP
jgi:4-phytase / acid phosphatase